MTPTKVPFGLNCPKESVKLKELRIIKIHFAILECVEQHCHQRTGLAEVRELVFRQPGTDDD
jgi:hypothetical protein